MQIKAPLKKMLMNIYKVWAIGRFLLILPEERKYKQNEREQGVYCRV